MRKTFKLISIALIASLLSSGLTSCYGNFSLTKKLYNWNGQVGDKWVNSGVMWLLFIVPVYEVVGAVDFLVLNTIQFWTGKNPMAMKAGEKEIQIVKLDNVEYKVTATKNRFDIKALEDDSKTISLVFDEQTTSWFVENNSEVTKIAQLDPADLNILQLIKPDGKTLSVDLKANKIITE